MTSETVLSDAQIIWLKRWAGVLRADSSSATKHFRPVIDISAFNSKRNSEPIVIFIFPICLPFAFSVAFKTIFYKLFNYA